MPRDPKELLYQLYEDRSRSEGGHYYLLASTEAIGTEGGTVYVPPQQRE